MVCESLMSWSETSSQSVTSFNGKSSSTRIKIKTYSQIANLKNIKRKAKMILKIKKTKCLMTSLGMSKISCKSTTKQVYPNKIHSLVKINIPVEII